MSRISANGCSGSRGTLCRRCLGLWFTLTATKPWVARSAPTGAPSSEHKSASSLLPGFDFGSLIGSGCELGCTSSSCDSTCRTAFAYCNRGGSSTQVCVASHTTTSTLHGWTNQINCSGGILACELSIRAGVCNESSNVRELVGAVFLDTDSGTADYRLLSPSQGVASLRFYVGGTPVPHFNGTFSLTPKDYSQKAWFDPLVQKATIDCATPLQAAYYLVAHAVVCPVPVNAPSAAPSATVAPNAATTAPLCPVPSPLSTPTMTLLNVATTPTADAETSQQSSPQVSETCAYGCDGSSDPCDVSCQNAFAICPNSSATCFPQNETTQGWINRIFCQGGSLMCDLRLVDNGCSSDTTLNSTRLIGTVDVNTAESDIMLRVTDPEYSVSSVHVLVTLDSTSASQPYSQQVWLGPGAKQIRVPLKPGLRSGLFIVAKARACSVTLHSETESLVTISPWSPSQVPSYSDALCPVHSLSPDASITPTIAIQTVSTSDPTVSTATAQDDDGGSNNTNTSTSVTDRADTDDVRGDGKASYAPSCPRTDRPSPRPNGNLIVLPPIFRPVLSLVPNSSPSLRTIRRRASDECGPDTDDEDGDDNEPTAIPAAKSGRPARPTANPALRSTATPSRIALATNPPSHVPSQEPVSGDSLASSDPSKSPFDSISTRRPTIQPTHAPALSIQPSPEPTTTVSPTTSPHPSNSDNPLSRPSAVPRSTSPSYDPQSRAPALSSNLTTAASQSSRPHLASRAPQPPVPPGSTSRPEAPTRDRGTEPTTEHPTPDAAEDAASKHPINAPARITDPPRKEDGGDGLHSTHTPEPTAEPSEEPTEEPTGVSHTDATTNPAQSAHDDEDDDASLAKPDLKEVPDNPSGAPDRTWD